MIRTKIYTPPDVVLPEVLRYMGAKEADEALLSLARDVIEEARDSFIFKVVWRELDVLHLGNEVDLGFCVTNSKNVNKYLQNSDKVIIFCATVGFEIDRLIRKWSVADSARCLALQALGSERVESLCDTFFEDIKEMLPEGVMALPRISPGYGDIPLSMQRDIFRALSPERNIGVSLNESLLMSPSKSVTALVGLSRCHD